MQYNINSERAQNMLLAKVSFRPTNDISCSANKPRQLAQNHYFKFPKNCKHSQVWVPVVAIQEKGGKILRQLPTTVKNCPVF